MKETIYTQSYCNDCQYCGCDVFGGAWCFAKGIVTNFYNHACSDDFEDKYSNKENNEL